MAFFGEMYRTKNNTISWLFYSRVGSDIGLETGNGSKSPVTNRLPTFADIRNYSLPTFLFLNILLNRKTERPFIT